MPPFSSGCQHILFLCLSGILFAEAETRTGWSEVINWVCLQHEPHFIKIKTKTKTKKRKTEA